MEQDDLERYRGELTGYCYRMLGSAFDAEDAVQETLIRAWRGVDRFENRSSPRTWLYRIATNVCLDALESSRRRARPMALTAPASNPTGPGAAWDDTALIEPLPDARLKAADTDPEVVATARETVRLAFIAALQHLPAKQRVALLLCEVLGFSVREVAEFQETTVAAVNSALQRARATLAARVDAPAPPAEDVQRALAARYADAFARYDMDALTMLLHVDATLSMPPYTTWLRGHADIQAWLTGPAIGCRGSRLIPTLANGSPAFGQYRPAPDGGHDPWALQVLETSGSRITAISFFRDTPRLFPLFNLPARLAPG
ncbi:MAG TPA: sigma-70 family RNA polymerase sigma factor [Yinghuangia sp.]|nr:sigma-70 family RNA polymerase sigma factor [Yinghuangia sp.]